MSRRKKFSPFVAFTATAALTLSTLPAFAAENASPALEETPEVQEIQDSQDILDSLAESGGVTVTLTLTEPLCSILTDSLGTDMSWLDTCSIGCVPLADGEGAVNLDLNETELISASFSYDEESQTLYLLCPELRNEAMAIDLQSLFQSTMESSGYSIPDVSITAEQLSPLMEKAEALIASISEEELSAFASRYAGVLMTSFEMGSESNVPVTAADQTENITVTTLRVSSEKLGPTLNTLLETLSGDELVKKVLTSDLADSICSLLDSSSEAGTVYQLAQSGLATLKSLVSSSQSSFPGLYLSYGSGAAGDFRKFSLGFEISESKSDFFELINLSSGSDIVFELNAGSLPASLLGLDSSQKTGLSVTGTMDGDIFKGKIDLIAGGASLFSLIFGESNLEILSYGQLLLTVSAEEGTSAVFTEIDRATAIPVRDQASLESYLEGANLDGIAGTWAALSGNMMADDAA